jgi:hypothetical protein
MCFRLPLLTGKIGTPAFGLVEPIFRWMVVLNRPCCSHKFALSRGLRLACASRGDGAGQARLATGPSWCLGFPKSWAPLSRCLPEQFWIFGTPARNTIRCSKNHFFCHPSFLNGPGKPGGIVTEVFQKSSNSRLMGKVPKFHRSSAHAATAGESKSPYS